MRPDKPTYADLLKLAHDAGLRTVIEPCVFCGRPRWKVRRLIVAPRARARICDECVDEAKKLLDEGQG